MDIKEKVKQEVREQLRGKLSEKKQIDESVGSKMAKAAGVFFGGTFGAGVGLGIGKVAAAVTLAVGLGLSVPASIIAAPAAGAVIAPVLMGLYLGSTVGLEFARRASVKDSEVLIPKLIDIIKKRDDVIKELAAKKEDPKAVESLKTQLEKLTDAQAELAKKVRKEIDWEFKKGLVTATEHEFANKLLAASEKGKLTYLKK